MNRAAAVNAPQTDRSSCPLTAYPHQQRGQASVKLFSASPTRPRGLPTGSAFVRVARMRAELCDAASSVVRRNGFGDWHIHEKATASRPRHPRSPMSGATPASRQGLRGRMRGINVDDEMIRLPSRPTSRLSPRQLQSPGRAPESRARSPTHTGLVPVGSLLDGGLHVNRSRWLNLSEKRFS